VRGSATLIVATIVALVAGYVGGGLRGADATPEVDDFARRIDALAAAATPTPERRRAAVERDRRIDALAETVAALRKTVESTPAVDEATADVRRLQKLDVPKLLGEVDDRTNRVLKPLVDNPVLEKDVAATLRACDVLLSRDLPPTERARGLLARGRVQMRGDRAAAEAALQEALKLVGPASPLGHVVAAQLGHTAGLHKDPRAAAEWFLSITRQPDAAPRERAMYQLLAANVLSGAGEVARARELYRAVSIEFGTAEDSYARKFAADAQAALAKLDADGGGR
jgi:hypothetical protein